VVEERDLQRMRSPILSSRRVTSSKSTNQTRWEPNP